VDELSRKKLSGIIRLTLTDGLFVVANKKRKVALATPAMRG
jgi:hypothetical protein